MVSKTSAPQDTQEPDTLGLILSALFGGIVIGAMVGIAALPAGGGL